MPKRAKLANFRSTSKVPHGSENFCSFPNIFQMKMDIFDKSAVVNGTVLEVMQPCNDQKTLLAGIMAMQQPNLPVHAAYSAYGNFVLQFIT